MPKKTTPPAPKLMPVPATALVLQLPLSYTLADLTVAIPPMPYRPYSEVFPRYTYDPATRIVTTPAEGSGYPDKITLRIAAGPGNLTGDSLVITKPFGTAPLVPPVTAPPVVTGELLPPARLTNGAFAIAPGQAFNALLNLTAGVKYQARITANAISNGGGVAVHFVNSGNGADHSYQKLTPGTNTYLLSVPKTGPYRFEIGSNGSSASISDMSLTVADATAPVVTTPTPPAPVILQRLDIIAPLSVDEGSTITLTVTAVYSDGSTVPNFTGITWDPNTPGGKLSPPANNVTGDGYQTTVRAKAGSLVATALVTIVDKTIVAAPVITPPVPTPTPTTPTLAQWDGREVRLNPFGDSITQLGYPDDYPTLLRTAYGPAHFVVDNQGKAGDRVVSELLNRYAAAVTQTYVANDFLNVLLLLAGVNDLSQSTPTPLDTLVAAYKKICQDAIAQGHLVIVATVLPCAKAGVQPRIDAFNARLRAEALSWGVAALYEAAYEPGLTDPTNTTYFADDTHPTPLGKHYLARGFKRVLDKLLIARGVPVPAYTWDIDSLPAPVGIRVTGPLPFNRDYVTYQQNPPLPYLDRIRRPGGDYDGDPGDPGEPLQYYGQRKFPTDLATEAFQPGINPVIKQIIFRDGRQHGAYGGPCIARGVRADGTKKVLATYVGKVDNKPETPFDVAYDPSIIAIEWDNTPTRVPNEIVVIAEYTPVAPDVVPQAVTFGLGAQADQDIKTYSVLLDPNTGYQSQVVEDAYAVTNGGFREFVSYDDFSLDPTSCVFEQMHGGGANEDALLLRAKADKKFVNVGLENCPTDILKTYPDYATNSYPERVPVPYGADPYNPESYEMLMVHIRQWFYRYGANKSIPDTWLKCKVAPFYATAPEAGGFTFQKGLGVMQLFSWFNEINGDWKDARYPGATATPGMVVAGCAKVYDELKPLYPEVTFLPPGFPSGQPDFIKEMYTYALKTRGRRADGTINVPWDAIEVHTYPDDVIANANGQLVPVGAPIEQSNAGRDLKLLFRAKKLFFDDVRILVGEIGRDTSRYSPNRVVVPAGNTQTPEEYAGVLAVRDALFLEELGMWRTEHYIIYPDTPDEYTKFHFMGAAQVVYNATTGKKGTVLLPKGSLLTQLNQQFGDFGFARRISSSPVVVERRNSAGKVLRSYHFDGKTNQKGTYSETIPAAGAMLYELELHSITPKRTPLAAGAYPVQVSENPVHILFN